MIEASRSGLPDYDDQGAELFARREVIRIPERGVHVPSWYDPSIHPRAHEIVIKKKGIPLMPTTYVAQVAPERRWAIGGDGELLPQHVFTNQFRQWRIEAFKYSDDKPQKPPMGWKPTAEPVPRVDRFVSMKVDPQNPKNPSLVPIHYDPKATAGTKPEYLYDAKGEGRRKRMDVLIETYGEEPQRLTQPEREEVENVLAARRISEGGPIPIKQEPTGIPVAEMSLAQIEALYEAKLKEAENEEPQVAMAPPAPKTPKPRNVDRKLRPCGKEISKNGFRFHRDACSTCQEAKEEA